jgi:hypothetical protein
MNTRILGENNFVINRFLQPRTARATKAVRST